MIVNCKLNRPHVIITVCVGVDKHCIHTGICIDVDILMLSPVNSLVT